MTSAFPAWVWAGFASLEAGMSGPAAHTQVRDGGHHDALKLTQELFQQTSVMGPFTGTCTAHIAK
jgi:hypothetical protein